MKPGVVAHARGHGLRFVAWCRRWPRALLEKFLWLAVLLAVPVALALVYRAPLADRLWPQARAQELREAAADALARGRLSAADGSGARELYVAALALDPDRDEARAGLQRVGLAALAQARVAMHAHRFDAAHRALRLARELAVPRAAVDAVAGELRRREAEVAGIDALLAQAAAARAAGRLDGDARAALPLYQRVLSLQPNRTEALEGREDALSDWLQEVDALLAGDALAEAAAVVERARGYDAGHAGLPAAQARIARAVDARRAQAARALARGRLQQATAGYREVLAVAADDAQALAGLERVAQAHAQRSERFAADFRFAEAQRELAAAHALAPRLPALARATRHLAQARQSQAQLQPPRGGAQRMRRVRQLLAEARAAADRGDLLAPPGDSAFDRLRAARALAPADADVRRASTRLLPAARSCFETELRGNRLGRAQACLDAWIQLGGSAGVRDARRRLAMRWLAVGDERLGAGELAAATRAHAAAQALDPEVPGLAELGERLRAAAPAGD